MDTCTPICGNELEDIIREIYEDSQEYRDSYDPYSARYSAEGSFSHVKDYTSLGRWEREKPVKYLNQMVEHTYTQLENRGLLMYNSPEMRFYSETPAGALGAIDLSSKEVYMDFESLVYSVGIEDTLGVYKHEVYLHGNCNFTQDPAIYLLERAFGRYGL